MNNTLRDGLALLQRLSASTEAHSVTALAEAMGLTRSHVHRLLQGLVEGGWVVQDPDRRYRIGLKPLELSSALLVHLPLRRAALPVLRQLAEETGYNAVLAQLVDGAALVIADEYRQQPDPATVVGRRLALHTSASGRLLAGYLPPERQAEILAGLALTPVEVQRVQDDWTRARLDHRGLNPPQADITMAGLAVPVRDGEQRVLAALGLALPAAEWTDQRVADLTERLRRAADTIRIPRSIP